jgi:hypothetical protein
MSPVQQVSLVAGAVPLRLVMSTSPWPFSVHTSPSSSAGFLPLSQPAFLVRDPALDQLMSQVAALTALVMADRAFKLEITERIDALVRLQAQPPPKIFWDCPVCGEPMSHMRSYKGHIKRLYDAYHSHSAAHSTDRKRCLLRENSPSHVNLVSRSGPPGSIFAVRSKAFAQALWLYVQNLTSSDDNHPDVMSQFDSGLGTAASGAITPGVVHVHATNAQTSLGQAPGTD